MTAVSGPDRAWLDQLDALRQAATEGPWSVDSDGDLIAASDPYTYVSTGAWPEDAALIVAAVNALPSLLAAARERGALRAAVEGLHLPSHAYCVVCDVDRDVEAVGNAFPCDHYTSFCRHCDFAWPCPTARVVADTTGEAL